jgi:hypothetical protein
MRVINLSRIVAAFAILLLAGACNDPSGPGGQYPESRVGTTQPDSPPEKPDDGKGGKNEPEPNTRIR